MTSRAKYFDNIKTAISPILQFASNLGQLVKATRNNSIDDLLILANQLETSDSASVKARGTFIRLQCKGLEAEDLFEEYREGWGIPKFQESLLSASDFRNGFLWTFRDHTTSWSEDQEAREWFYTNLEARFIYNYEFWACDHGPEEIVFKESGDYKEILWTLVKQGDYGPMISPIFTKEELQEFLFQFDEDELGFEKEKLLEIIIQNQNW
jgi:hypothetical protein